jgi:hypothetical protein
VVSGKSVTLVNLFDPETMAIAGTPFEARYFAVAEFPGVRDVVYFTPVNPAAVVDGLNVGEDSPADESDGRGRPAERKYAADLDLGRP